MHSFSLEDKRISFTKHTQVVFFNFFFTSGGVLSITIGMLYESTVLGPFVKPQLPDPLAMKMILIGIAISLSMFVSTHCRDFAGGVKTFTHSSELGMCPLRVRITKLV